MLRHIKNEKYFYLSLIFFAVLAFLVQNLSFMNGDVGSLLYDARLFLHGGTYITDFFETNPPMIFILYSPIWFIKKIVAMNIITITRIYIIAIAIVSIGYCHYLLKKIIQPKDYRIHVLFLAALLYVFLFLPTVEFGQREHLYLMLLLPYLLAAVLYADTVVINKKIAISIGVMAALGIGMKPYFLAPLILVECYFIFMTRQLFGWVRPESCVLAALLVLYLIGVLYFYPTYFHIMLPLVSHLYYISIEQPWFMVFSRLPVVFSLFTMVMGFFLFKKIILYRHFIIIFQLALIGAIIAFIIPRAAWFYHVFPAVGLATLLMSLYISHAVYCDWHRKSLVVFLVIAGFAVPLYFFYVGLHYAIFVKQKSSLNPMIAYINSLPTPPSIYCFSANTTGDCFTLIYFTQSTYKGRYPFFWWMGGLKRLEDHYTVLPQQIRQDKNFLIDALVYDLEYGQPDLLIINRSDAKKSLGHHFDFVTYFSQNPQFRAAWQSYHYFKTIGVFDLYQRRQQREEI